MPSPGCWTSCWAWQLGADGQVGRRMWRQNGESMGKKSIPNPGLCVRPAIGASLEGTRVPWECAGGGPRFVPFMCTVCQPFPYAQASKAGPLSPSPAHIHSSLIIKFSIFGVLVSCFPGTERRRERDWKQPFVPRSCLSFPISSLCLVCPNPS